MAQRKRLNGWQRLGFWLAGRLAALLCRLWFATCRVEMISKEWAAWVFDEGHPAVGVTWHRGAVYFLHYFGRHRPVIMVSRSKDGEYLASYIKALGGVPVRGSSRRGGRQALEQMSHILRQGQCRYAATVADGPRGPRYQAKRGMIALAQATGVPLFPIMWSANRCWVLKKTWDQTILPKPFSKIYIKTAEPISYPPDMTHEDMERARQELEDTLNRLRRELDELAGLA